MMSLTSIHASVYCYECDTTMEENIGNHGYIGDISAGILEKNIGKLKIVKNSWKCKKNLIII